MIGFCPLASGSKGNCTYFASKNTRILIDVGISTRLLEKRLDELGVGLDTIDAILITHEHIDHIRGLPVLLKKRDIPVLTNSETARAIYQTIGTCPRFKLFTTGEPFEFGDLKINPFSVQHDAADPVMFTIEAEGVKFGFCTDLGFVSTLVASQLRGANYLVIEANHQPSMVHACSRSPVYKQRVLGRLGHLSNEECARTLLDIHHDGLKHVHLAHLSSECNNPELALQIVKEHLLTHGKEVEIAIAYQEKISKQIPFHTFSVSPS